MKRFRCGDVIPNCDFAVEGTEETILSAVARHAAQDHQVTATPELVARVRAHIVDI